ncbi:MAG TPA: hypothetical protein VGE18_00885 [Candidatus Paceibacterota bacterium]
MEVKEYLSKEYFEILFRTLEKEGFILRSRQEVIDDLRKNKIAPSIRKATRGMQTIYQFTANGKLVLVLTTYLASEERPKKAGYGWVLILDPEKHEPFFSFEMRRTKGFTAKVLENALLFKEIVSSWPTCMRCGKPLILVEVPRVMHMRAFTCRNTAVIHPGKRPWFWIVEMKLSDKSTATLIKSFKNYYRYRIKLAEKNYQEGVDEMPEHRRVIRSQQKKKKTAEANRKNIVPIDPEIDYSQYNEDHSE